MKCTWSLNRVDEIVSRGWGRGEHPGSPNNFGNFETGEGGDGKSGEKKWGADVREALEGLGIEQRLEAVRGL